MINYIHGDILVLMVLWSLFKNVTYEEKKAYY